MRRVGVVLTTLTVVLFVSVEGALACKFLDNLLGRGRARSCASCCQVQPVCCEPVSCEPCGPPACGPAEAAAEEAAPAAAPMKRSPAAIAISVLFIGGKPGWFESR